MKQSTPMMPKTYDSVHLDEEGLQTGEQQSVSSSAFSYGLPRLLSFALFFLVATSIAVVLLHPALGISTLPANSCGTTAAEARAAHCHFDMMSFCWLPSPCYDAELSAEFLARSNWTWYRDQTAQQPVSLAEVQSGAHDELFVSYDYHLAHCTFMWRKLHRAVLGVGNAGIDGYIGNYAHTRHCEMMILDMAGVEGSRLNTIIKTKFPTCGIQ